MAEITLSTLVLFFLALPGFVARSSYHSDEFSRAMLPASLIEDLMGALLFAFPLHFICLLISEGLHHISAAVWFPIVPDINFAKIVRLLAANFDPEGEYSLNAIVENAYTNWKCVTAYAIMIYSFAWYGGHIVRDWVWENDLDLKKPNLFRFRNYWVYRLTGRGIAQGHKPNYTVVQALSRVGDRSVIYGGFLASFIVNEKGELLDLVLSKARRAELVTDREDYTWVEIEGSLFVFKYSEAINLNLSYYYVAPDGKYSLLEVRQF